ncbi:MAG: hypothetical protein WC783_03310 [Candidatus Paceibacterota bacterium]|jgi:hypothetical protein
MSNNSNALVGCFTVIIIILMVAAEFLVGQWALRYVAENLFDKMIDFWTAMGIILAVDLLIWVFKPRK